MAAAALRAAALAALLACCAAWTEADQPKLSPHEVMVRVIRVNNGTVDLEVRDIPGKGRGLVAFRDMAKNQVAVQLPHTMAFQLAPAGKAVEVRAGDTRCHGAQTRLCASGWYSRRFYRQAPAA